MTEYVLVTKTGGGWKVEARGGYDGFLRREFTDKQEMIDFITYLWDN